MIDDLQTILSRFCFDSDPIVCSKYGNGLLNKTYLILCRSEKKYILQRINDYVFHDIDALMNNIRLITEHLQRKIPNENGVMRLVKTRDGAIYYRDNAGGCWRVFHFVEGGLCLESADSPDTFYQVGVAFGGFQQQCQDFPIQLLIETIPDFHNTPKRYAQLRDAISMAIPERRRKAQQEISFCLDREQQAGRLQKSRNDGTLPVRVTHNDAKMNNVMLQVGSKIPLCILDLDTVMPGLSLYDYGDAIRYGASTAGEDTTDLSKIYFDLDMIRAFTDGFTYGFPGMTTTEKECLPLSIWTITLEQGVRFLSDYLIGDPYYGEVWKEQNLFRARTQLKLVSDFEQRQKEIAEAIEGACYDAKG